MTLCAGGIVATLALGTPASAQQLFTSSADFFAALNTPFVTETFEGFANNTLITPGSTVNGITYDSFPDGTNGRIDNLYNKIGNFSLALERDGELNAFFFDGEGFTVTFPSSVTAVGIFFNANATSNDQGLFIQTPVGTAGTGGPTSNYDQSTLFFAGIISDTPFNTVTFGSIAGESSAYNVDNLTFAPFVAAPEPGAIALLPFGLLALGVARRSMRRL
jgi:hypothetical protein